VDENNQLYVNDKPMVQERGPTYAGPKQDLWNYAVLPRTLSNWAPNATSSCLPTAASKPASGWCPRALFLHGRQSQQQQDSRWLDDIDAPGFVPAQNLVVKRCEFGLILILVTGLSGDGSGMRFNERSYEEAET